MDGDLEDLVTLNCRHLNAGLNNWASKSRYKRVSGAHDDGTKAMRMCSTDLMRKRFLSRSAREPFNYPGNSVLFGAVRGCGHAVTLCIVQFDSKVDQIKSDS